MGIWFILVNAVLNSIIAIRPPAPEWNVPQEVLDYIGYAKGLNDYVPVQEGILCIVYLGSMFVAVMLTNAILWILDQLPTGG